MPNIVNGLGQVKVGVRTQVSGGISYLLDTYSGAAAAYSLRKLRNSYTGSAIRVRRSSDNTTLDVGFDANGNLDTASMLSFVGSNNQALYSEEFDNAYWSKYITTVTPNQTTAPDGTMTADLLAENTSNNYHTLYNATALSFAVGTSWNVSVYVKKGPGTSAPNTIILGFPSPTTNTFPHPCVLFDISSGVVLDSSNASNDANFGSSIVDAGNGWWRCSVWGTVTAAGNRYQVGVIRFNNNLNTLNTSMYVGSTQSNIYIWGYQFQKALNDTSVLTTQPYIKTTATIAAGNGFVSIWYDQSGNNIDRSNTTQSQQPQIISNGTLITANGKSAMLFDGSNDQFLQQTPTLSDNGSTIFNVSKLGAGYSPTNEYPLFGGLANTSVRFSVLNNKWYLINSGTGISSSGDVTTNQVLSTVLFAPTDKVRINGSEVISGNVGTGGGDTYIGRSWLSKFYLGNIQEHIVYLSNKTSDFSGIESNINSYYSIY